MPLIENAHRVAQAFKTRFGSAPRVFQAPGRINIIGEHTDYNEGLVMPAAIDRRCLVAIRANRDRAINVVSRNFDAGARLELDRLTPTGEWVDYVAGVASVLIKAQVPVPGCDVLIDSDVPMGAGVSSSAALEKSPFCISR